MNDTVGEFDSDMNGVTDIDMDEVGDLGGLFVGDCDELLDTNGLEVCVSEGDAVKDDDDVPVGSEVPSNTKHR